MIYSFIYESNAYALKHGLSHCVQIEVELFCTLSSEIDGKQVFHIIKNTKWLSITTEHGIDVHEEFSKDQDLGIELVNECQRHDDKICAKYADSLCAS